jgi:superfamily I DNA/RNA helicase
MIEIQIAGAGSGKTYGLAKTLADKYKKLSNDKIIYALTYTNAATQKINIELIKILGEIPSSIKVETVHSFLLNEVIYPFSSFITGDIYNNTSTTPLSNKQTWRASTIARLKTANVVHAESVYAVSRKILDSSHSSNKSKAKKVKVAKIISILKSNIESIYIDEVQDLDLDALNSFKSIGLLGVYIYMIGDPKQAIKYPKILSNFITDLKKECPNSVQIPKINNLTRRVPSEILKLSNKFCYEGQSQISLSKDVGALTYIESSANEFEEFLTQHISSDSIVCIDQKNKKYSTNKSTRFSFDPKIQKKIATSNHGQDPELAVKAAYTEFVRQVNSHNTKFAVYALIKKFTLDLEKQEFGMLFSLGEQLSEVPARYTVSSIDSVKGLDADNCIIILTNTIYNYLRQTDLKEENKFNKIWKRVYVALTRAKKNVIIVLDFDIFSKNKIKEIKKELVDLDFIPHEMI